MANQAGFQKAFLQIEGGEKIEAWFNPKEYSLGRTNKWEVKPVRASAFAGAFPVKWQGPTMNAGSSNIATETLEIVHQGFQPTKA